MNVDKKVCVKEDCSLDLSVCSIKYYYNCLVLLNSGFSHLTPVESYFYEAKTSFEQGKMDGNRSVKCYLHHWSGPEHPASGFTSHLQTVSWFYVPLKPRHMSSASPNLLDISTGHLPLHIAYSKLLHSSSLSLSLLLTVVHVTNASFSLRSGAKGHSCTHVQRRHGDYQHSPASSMLYLPALLCLSCLETSLPYQYIQFHLPWLTASRQSFGASRTAHSALETSPLIPLNQGQPITPHIRHCQVKLLMCCVISLCLKWKNFPASPTPCILILLPWPSPPHHHQHPSSSPPPTTALLWACSGLPQSSGGEVVNLMMVRPTPV